MNLARSLWAKVMRREKKIQIAATHLKSLELAARWTDPRARKTEPAAPYTLYSIHGTLNFIIPPKPICSFGGNNIARGKLF